MKYQRKIYNETEYFYFVFKDYIKGGGLTDELQKKKKKIYS